MRIPVDAIKIGPREREISPALVDVMRIPACIGAPPITGAVDRRFPWLMDRYRQFTEARAKVFLKNNVLAQEFPVVGRTAFEGSACFLEVSRYGFDAGRESGRESGIGSKGSSRKGAPDKLRGGG